MFAEHHPTMHDAPPQTVASRIVALKLGAPCRAAVALFALACVGLAGCGASPGQVVLPLAAADAATVPVLGRGIGDAVYSAASGKDCSIVRLDRGQSYCKPKEPPPQQQQFCTRSLGVVDCWTNPEALNGGPPQGVADGPTTLTPEQEANRTSRWPKL